MTQLPLTFTKSGWTFRQVWREGDQAIYRKEKGNTVVYESIRVLSHDGYEIAGKRVEPAEYYPGNEAWGTDGFTCGSFERALERVGDL
jgi:hypothetical protein